MAKPAAALPDLPEELISNIASRLWSDDIQSLRLSCKSLEQKSLHEFATEYFTDKCFMITTDSLKVLNNIASSEKLRGYLRRVHIITAYFSESALACLACSHGPNCKGRWKPNVRQREVWRFYCDDQKALKESGRDQEMLTEALSKLTTLKGVFLTDLPDLDTDIRPMQKIVRLTNRKPMMTTGAKNVEYTRVLSHTWRIVTSALADSGITSLKQFGTVLCRGESMLRAYADTRFTDQKIAGLKKAFKGLETLHLQMSSKMSAKADLDRSKAFVKTTKALKKFSTIFPALETLDFNFDQEGAAASSCMAFLQMLNLSKVKTVHVDTARTDRNMLASILERLHSVQTLQLVSVDLSKGSWRPILKVLQTMTDHLNHLHLMFLTESSKKVYFLKQPEEEEDPLYDVLGGPPFGVDDYDYSDDGENESDEDMPPLEAIGGAEVGSGDFMSPDLAGISSNVPSSGAAPPAPTGKGDAMSGGKSSEPQDNHANTTNEHKAPCRADDPQRGYYVCVRGEEIAQELPIFFKEYNLGSHVMDDLADDLGFPIPMGPGGANNFINGLAATLGLPPGAHPGTMAPPPPGAHGGHANGNGHPHAHGQTGGGAGTATGAHGGNGQASAGAAGHAATTHGVGPVPIPANYIPGGLAALLGGGPPPPPPGGAHGAAAGGSAAGPTGDGWETDEDEVDLDFGVD